MNGPRTRGGLSRRNLLRLGAAGAGLLVVRGALPNAHAGPKAVKRILIINVAGGIRSSAAFNAAPEGTANWQAHNPWGHITDTNTPFALGKLLDDHISKSALITSDFSDENGEDPRPSDDAYTTLPEGGWAGAKLPRFRDMASKFSVVGTWHEGRGDHLRSAIEEPTGSPDGGQAGLITRLLAGLSDEHGSQDVPGFHLNPMAQFGLTNAAVALHAPVRLDGTISLPSSANVDASVLDTIGRDWAPDETMRGRLDLRRMAATTGYNRRLVRTYNAHRLTNLRIGPRLAEDWVNVNGVKTAAYGTVRLPSGGEVPLTNAMLLELATLASGPGKTMLNDSVRDVMLGVRLLQLGSPAVCVELAGFDTHSGEIGGAPPMYRTLGKLWANLHFLLGALRESDDSGDSMLDNTLVITMSDFGRDRGTLKGFNGGEGTDHGVDPCCFYLAHAVMGGGIPANKLIGSVPLESFDARKADARYSHRQLIATLLAAMGLDHRNETWGLEDVSTVVPLFGAAS